MSKYSENTTQFKDCNTLVDALVEMGFERNEIEVHQTAQLLKDYHGKNTRYLNGVDYDTAEIIIRQGAVNRHITGGSSNDLGFRKNANGTYSAIISEYDSRYMDSQWLAKVRTNYAQCGLVKQMAKQGAKLVNNQTKNGKRILQFVQA